MNSIMAIKHIDGVDVYHVVIENKETIELSFNMDYVEYFALDLIKHIANYNIQSIYVTDYMVKYDKYNYYDLETICGVTNVALIVKTNTEVMTI